MKSLLSLLVGIAAVSLLVACAGNPPPAAPPKAEPAKPVAAAEKPAEPSTPAPVTKDLPRTDESSSVKIKAVDEKGKVMLEFKTVYFDFDKYNIRPDSKPAISFDAQELNKVPNLKIIIEGHCDERGTTEYNLALGEHRAVAVMHALEAAGVGKGRLKTISYGKERPADSGHDEAAWAKNRRSIVRES